MKLKDSLAVKGIVALGIAISPALIINSCTKFRDKIILSSDTQVKAYKDKIRRQLECLVKNK